MGLSATGFSQAKAYDTLAIVVLDHMSSVIGDLTSCRFTLTTETDQTDPLLGSVTLHQVSNVWFSGPARLLIEAKGHKGHQGLWYNGETLTIYSFAENNYVVIPVPENTIAMIDSVNDIYGIDFPAADIFNPTLSDDLLQGSDELSFLGRKMIGDQSCFQVVARNSEMTVQIWVSDDVLFLPVKFVITYHRPFRETRYEANFSGWQINPSLPDALFEFSIPPNAHEISILPGK